MMNYDCTFDELLNEYNARFEALTSASQFHTEESYQKFNKFSLWLFKKDAKLVKKYSKYLNKALKCEMRKNLGFVARLKRALGLIPREKPTRVSSNETLDVEEISPLAEENESLKNQIEQLTLQLEQQKQQQLLQQSTSIDVDYTV